MCSELEHLNDTQAHALRTQNDGNLKLDALVSLMAEQNAMMKRQFEQQNEDAARVNRDNKVMRLQNARQLLKTHFRNDPPRLDNQTGGYWALARIHENITAFADPYTARTTTNYAQPAEVLQSCTDELLQLWMKGFGKHVHRFAPSDLKLLRDVLECVVGTRGVTREQAMGEGEGMQMQLCLFYE